MTSEDYLDSSYEQKIKKIKSALNKLAENGTDKYPKKLIKKNSILLTGTDNNKMFTFQYANGVLEGIQIVDNKLEYKIIDPIFIMDTTSSRFKERGVYYDTLNQPNEPSIYTISLGIKPSGGFGVKISKVNIDENESAEIIVEESYPKKGETSTSALSIPICQINFNHSPKNIIVKNQDGEIYSSINY